MSQFPQQQMPPPQPARSNTGLIVGIIVGCVVVVGLLGTCMAGVFLPALGKARQSARQLKSSVQLQQIGSGLMIYASDNKGWLPETANGWQTRLSQYVPLQEFTAPDDQPGAVSYYYVPGYCLSKIKNPPTTVLAYERPGLRRHGGNILYADGHVDFVTDPAYERTINSITTPDGKPYAPHKSGGSQ